MPDGLPWADAVVIPLGCPGRADVCRSGVGSEVRRTDAGRRWAASTPRGTLGSPRLASRTSARPVVERSRVGILATPHEAPGRVACGGELERSRLRAQAWLDDALRALGRCKREVILGRRAIPRSKPAAPAARLQRASQA